MMEEIEEAKEHISLYCRFNYDYLLEHVNGFYNRASGTI